MLEFIDSVCEKNPENANFHKVKTSVFPVVFTKTLTMNSTTRFAVLYLGDSLSAVKEVEANLLQKVVVVK
jgi:hypothetical protein